MQGADSPDLRIEWQALAQQRLRAVCFAMMVALPFSAIVNTWLGFYFTGVSAVVATLLAGATAWQLRRGRIPADRASVGIFLLWAVVAGAILLSFYDLDSSAPGLWMALLITGYGAIQLHGRWFTPALVIGALGWLAMVCWLKAPDLSTQIVGLVASLVLAILAFRSNRALIRRDLRLRSLEAVRQRQLADALAAAEHELNERRQAERDREALREQFVAAQRLEAVGSLAGGVAHDMNNILSSIGTMAGLMERTATPQQKVDLALISQACNRGATLTNSLLGFSRKARYQKARIPIVAAVDDALSILRRTLRKEVRLVRREINTDLYVDVDRNHLAQALLNLCINAERAIGVAGGTITVTVYQRPISTAEAQRLGVAPGEFVALSVSDDGCGMDEETRQHAFEPFFTTRPVGEGSGLGLAMAYGTLRAHEGAITIESAVDVGTVVQCLLPLAEVAAVAEPIAKPLAAPPAVTSSATPAAPRTVLLVDDERLVRYSIVRLLTEHGCDVLTADDGEEGVELFLLHRSRIDLVLLDMSMPRMNGAECYRWLRSVEPAVPIVCISGFPLDPQTRQFMGGEIDAIEKPFSPEELFTVMANALARAHQQARDPIEPPPERMPPAGELAAPAA